MSFERTAVGLDVHARSTYAWALDTRTGEVFAERLLADPATALAWLHKLPGPLVCAYEAGPTGYGLARTLNAADGIRCLVAAPSKMERPKGDRIKNDKRDAMRLAKLVHLEEIPTVRIPTEHEEAARDLLRSRDDVRRHLMRARSNLTAMLLRHGQVYYDGGTWTREHHRWLARQHFTDPAATSAYGELLETVLESEARLERMSTTVRALAEDATWQQAVIRLRCLRGIDTLAAVNLAVEIGDWHRFTGATLPSYLGLVPSDHSSGASERHGAITKSGNTHVRRLLVEAAWCHLRPYRKASAALQVRLDAAPPAVRHRADQANRRLHHRWQSFEDRRKRRTVAAVAIARELSSWCWSLVTLDC
jgi:transposase